MNRFLATALLPFLLVGCGAAPLDYHSGNEIPRGPGMFTGDEGALVIRAGGSAREAPQAAAREPAKPGEYEEFQRWKKERSASEQREFQEWREWREYQEWKKQQSR